MSTIFDNLDADSKKVSLLQGAQNKKDSTYVSANLAKAYAGAGFLDKARDCLEHLTKEQQREPIVISAYEKIESVEKENEEINSKLLEASKHQRRLVDEILMSDNIIISSNDALKELIGFWKVDDKTLMSISYKEETLEVGIKTSNQDYSSAHYKTEASFQNGILEIQATLNIDSLVQTNDNSNTGKGLGILSRSLLFPISPSKQLNFLLFKTKDNRLKGLRWIPHDNESDISSMIKAETIYLDRTSNIDSDNLRTA